MDSLTVDPAMRWFDHVPPGRPEVRVQRISRGVGPIISGEFMTSTSCDDIGSIQFEIDVRDNYYSPLELGYAIAVVEVVAQGQLMVPSEPIVSGLADFRSGISWRWTDGAVDEQELIDLTVVLRAIDPAGNVSEPSEPVRIHHPGWVRGERIGREDSEIAIDPG